MIEISHVDKWYGPSFQALKDCTTGVAKGEVVVVCGPSGSGKSTLIKCVNALEPFQGGEITVDGIRVNDPKTDLPKLRARVTDDETRALIALLREVAQVALDVQDPPRRSADAGDDYLLALAETENAMLVSGDADVLGLTDRFPIRSPRAFLELLDLEA